MGDESSSTLLLLGSGILVGAIIALGTWNIVSQLEDHTLERVVARDLGLALATVISSPGDIDVRYIPRDDRLRISINQSIVQVYGNTGSSTFRYPRILDVDTQGALLVNAMSVPIRKQGNLLFFEEITTGCDFPYTVRALAWSLGHENHPELFEKLLEYSRESDKIHQNGWRFELVVAKGDSNIVEYYGGENLLAYRKFACLVYEYDDSFEFVQRDTRGIRMTLIEDDPAPIIYAVERLVR